MQWEDAGRPDPSVEMLNYVINYWKCGWYNHCTMIREFRSHVLNYTGGGGVCPEGGGVCLGGVHHQQPPVDRILDTRLWKHYRSATTVADGNKVREWTEHACKQTHHCHQHNAKPFAGLEQMSVVLIWGLCFDWFSSCTLSVLKIFHFT